MNRFIKIIVRLVFYIWLINQVIPNMLAENEIVSIIVKLGFYLHITVLVLAMSAFVITLIPKKKTASINQERKKIILHDLDDDTAKNLLQEIPNAKIFSANKKIAPCKGCFGCWLQTPSLCIIHDSAENAGREMAYCEEFIIISKNLYGGFSKEIKNVLDRSISGVLPFFAVRNKELHHQRRYESGGTMKTIIYHSNEVTDADKEILRAVTKANSINFEKNVYETIFVNDVNEIKEAVI
jgi:hypothetical protein